MADLFGREANCPWRNKKYCPLLSPELVPKEGVPTSSQVLPINLRLDVNRDHLIACACLASPKETVLAIERGEVRSDPNAPHPYLEVVENPLAHLSRADWKALSLLLRTPMKGLCALGLRLLPDRVQDLLLTSVQQGQKVTFRLNLQPEAVPEDPMAILALRALCEHLRVELQMSEEWNARSEAGLQELGGNPLRSLLTASSSPVSTDPAAPGLRSGNPEQAPAMLSVGSPSPSKLDGSGGPSEPPPPILGPSGV